MLRCSSSDAAYAWRKMDGIPVDGRKWKVDYATKVCFMWYCCIQKGMHEPAVSTYCLVLERD